MTSILDSKKWTAALKEPDWYIRLATEIEKIDQLLSQIYQKDQQKAKTLKGQVYQRIEEALLVDEINLAKSGSNNDQERQPVDTVVIHHSKNRPGMSLSRLNAIHLLNLYAKYYKNPKYDRDKGIVGQPIWSNHFKNGRQVFYGYHWFVRQSGEAERLLKDSQIGWHAGDWRVNARSVGICIDDDLSQKSPTKTVIKALSELIKRNYPNVSKQRIFGHSEINKKTECPGSEFAVWKKEINKNIF